MAADPSSFCELYRDYLSDAWEALARLRLACEQRHSTDLASKAHYLKSSSLVLGIRPIGQRCAELERLGREKDFQEASRQIEDLRELLLQVQAELELKLGPQVVPSAA
jgi:HPt (histidine-containing phosphotransfer) domain-containing protein